MVNTITEEKGKNTEEGDCEGDSLEVIFTKFLLWLIFLSELFQVLLKQRCVCEREWESRHVTWVVGEEQRVQSL